MSFQIVSFYQFKPLHQRALPALARCLLKEGKKYSIRGLILLSEEGLNVTFSGGAKEAALYLQHLEQLTPPARPVVYKSFSSPVPGFKRLSVKIKRSIITMDKKTKPGGTPVDLSDVSLSPAEAQKLLDQKDTVVLDIRNDYETALGRFKNSTQLSGMKEFSEFPARLKTASFYKDRNQGRKTLLYCTGGIRCEKALLEMRRQGFKEVYLLKGGILNYLKSFPNKSFQGECFVFDHRAAVDQQGRPSKIYSLCPHCGQPASIQKTCRHCKKLFKICVLCLQKKLSWLITCSKNCAHHFQQGHRFKGRSK